LFEKPPLYYWGAAASFKIFGVSETAARLPSAISALLATLALAWLAWRMYGTETARWLLLLLPTTVGMISFSHAAATDMPFSGMLTIAMVCAAVVLRLVPSTEGRASPARSSLSTAWSALVLFGFFLGLAVLAKGPAGIILCGGAVFFWAIFTMRWRDAFRLLHPAAIAAFCVTALPWYILCARRNPDFFRVFIIEHNFKRYLTPEFQHIQPFWFYVPVLLAALFPWTVLFGWAAFAGSFRLWRARRLDHFNWLLLCWAGFTFLFFTISKSKLPGYVLPAVAPIVLLTTHFSVLPFSASGFSWRWPFAANGLTLALVGVVVGHFSYSFPFVTDVRPPAGPSEFAVIAFFGGLASAALASFRRSRACLMAAALTIMGLMTLDTADLWQLDEGVSARPAVVEALEHMTSDQAAAATEFKLRRAYKYQVDFYLHRETQEWSPGVKKHSVIFTDFKNSEELMRLGARCPAYIAFPSVWVCESPKGDPILVH
jgi:4-amino-4-deoxy-L-arabinose transferase-like glycosyltransferase